MSEDTDTITIKVVYEISGRPASDIEVSLEFADGFLDSEFTDEQGDAEFEIPSSLAGTTVTVYADGEDVYTGVIEDTHIVEIESENQDLERAFRDNEVELDEDGNFTIGIQVSRASDGSPVEGVEVSIDFGDSSSESDWTDSGGYAEISVPGSLFGCDCKVCVNGEEYEETADNSITIEIESDDDETENGNEDDSSDSQSEGTSDNDDESGDDQDGKSSENDSDNTY